MKFKVGDWIIWNSSYDRESEFLKITKIYSGGHHYFHNSSGYLTNNTIETECTKLTPLKAALYGIDIDELTKIKN